MVLQTPRISSDAFNNFAGLTVPIDEDDDITGLSGSSYRVPSCNPIINAQPISRITRVGSNAVHRFGVIPAKWIFEPMAAWEQVNKGITIKVPVAINVTWINTVIPSSEFLRCRLNKFAIEPDLPEFFVGIFPNGIIGQFGELSKRDNRADVFLKICRNRAVVLAASVNEQQKCER